MIANEQVLMEEKFEDEDEHGYGCSNKVKE